MATDIVGSLFGISPEAIAQQQSLANEKAAFSYANLSAPEQAQYGAFMGGRQLAGAVSNMLGVEDDEMKQAAIAQKLSTQFNSTTVEGMEQFANALNQAGAPKFAALAIDRRNKMLESQATVAAKMREKVPVVGEQVNQQLFNNFKNQAIKMGATGDQVDLVAAQLYDKYEQSKQVQRAAAGVPAPGNVPIDALNVGTKLVKEFTGEASDSLKQIQLIGATGAALKTNPTLLPQFKTQIAQFTKDKQLSGKQIEKALGSEGIAADVIEGFNNFITGKPTDIKIDDVLRGTKALEKVYADQYTQGRKRAATVLEQAKFAPETQAALLPPAYNTAPSKPASNAPAVGSVKSGYRFKGGNPAVQSNWEAVQ